jgi:predicted dehydrogenase
MSQFAVALIGGGNIAKAHLAAAKESGGRVRIAAVVDPADEPRESVMRDAGAPGFASTEALLNSSEASQIRAGIVATPPNARLPIVRALLERGIAVLVEKPLAHTLLDAQILKDLAERYPQVVTSVGYCHRFTPAIVEIKKRVAAGEIGEPSRFENTFACPLPKMQSHWMSDPSVSGGGSFIDTGSHSLDLFHYLLGEGEVLAATFHHAWPGRGESSATALLRQTAGSGTSRAAGVIQSGWLEPARFAVTVVGTNGSLSYDYERPTELLHRFNTGELEKIEVEDHGHRFTTQLQAFADAVVNGARPPLASFRDGLAAAALVDAARTMAHNT